jgi:ppGpp synthetase/RelA/SpoT-type nucleotidyltranferase
MPDVPSPSRVKKAGSRIRRYMRGDEHDLDRALEEVEVMERWRRAHYVPLVSANNGLRSRARTLGINAEVTQRLKRRQTILEKLQREPTLDLSRMQDIGGCRAVVPDHADLRRLEARVVSRLPVVNVDDRVKTPRISGYRAVHIVVLYQGRAVEIQLRTQSMHAWALAAEDYSGEIGENLKQDGTHPIQLFLAAAADIMDLNERGLPVPLELRELHESRRVAARPFLSGGSS